MVTLRMLFQEVQKGKSIARILTNQVIAQWASEITGIVLDLACGREPSYRRFLNLTKNNPSIRLIGVDYNPSYHPTIVADLAQSLPFKSEVANVAILSSFLYIPPNPEQVLQDIGRVLNRDGFLLITAPLVFPYNPEPTDHWRFTGEGLRLLLSRAGFIVEQLIPFGGRWTAAAYLLSPFLRPRWLIALLIYWICLKLDALTTHFKQLPPCPIGYIVKARKQ